MARVLVVSRNPAMAMGLSSTDYDVVDLRPPSFAAWIDGDDDTDALILDLENPALALAAVTNLRAHAKLAPVLLVSSDKPGWDDLAMRNLPAAEVLPLPITLPALLSALKDLLREPWAVEPSQSVEAMGELIADMGDTPPSSDDLDGLIYAPHHYDEELPALPEIPVAEPQAETPASGAHQGHRKRPRPVGAKAPSTPDPTPAPTPDDEVPSHVPLSAVPRTRRSTPMPHRPPGAPDVVADLRRAMTGAPPARATHKAGRPSADQAANQALAPTEPAVVRGTRSATTPDPVLLVRELTAIADRLYGVPETAEVVITDAVDRTGAGAGVLLIPDEDRWRVAGGVNLRSLERRYELHADSWLIQQIARAHKGAIIEESDVARLPLQGAPLASWRHLLAAPVPMIEGLMLLARKDDPAFSEDDLSTLAILGEEAGPLLAAAVETRALARTMWEFRDEDDLPR